MKVEIYQGEAKAAIKNKQEPEIGTLVDYDGGVDADGDRCAVVKDSEGFFRSVWLGSLRAAPVAAVAKKK